MTGIGSHHVPSAATWGNRDDWLTPPEIIEALGPFDLDPCASVNPPWPTAINHYTWRDDGLTQPWQGFVWCNPPYGRETAKWLHRLANHNQGIALVFARTETAMFFAQVWERASALLFLKGRLVFRAPITGTPGKSNAGAPSVLIAYGQEGAHRLRESALLGAYVEGWRVTKRNVHEV